MRSTCLAVVLILGSRIYELSISSKSATSMTLNGEMALILRYFTEFGIFRDVLHKSGDKAITTDNL